MLLIVGVLLAAVYVAASRTEIERSLPDVIDLGEVYPDCTVEFSVSFLAGPHRPLIDRVWEWLARVSPASVADWLWDHHPRKNRKVASLSRAELAALPEPTVDLPSFVHRVEMELRQEPNRFGGHVYFHGRFRVETSDLPAPAAATLTVNWGKRETSTPLRYTLRTGPLPTQRILVVGSPFHSTVYEGVELEEVTSLLAGLDRLVDIRRQIPMRLEKYSVILMTGIGMTGIKDAEATRLQQFAAEGGRLIVMSSPFDGGPVPTGSVESANRLLRVHGLESLYRTRTTPGHPSTRFADHPMTRGLRELRLGNTSLIRLKEGSSGRFLVSTDDGRFGLLALVEFPGGGEIYLLSLYSWASWLHRYPVLSDEARLMRNLLAK